MVPIYRVLSYTARLCDSVRMTSARVLSEVTFAVSSGSQVFSRLDRVTCGPCREFALGNSNWKAIAP